MQKIVYLGSFHIARGKSRKNEKVRIYKRALLNWSHCGQLWIISLVYRMLKMIYSKFGMGMHLTIDFYIPQLVCRYHVGDHFTVVSEKFWGIDEKLPEGAQT